MSVLSNIETCQQNDREHTIACIKRMIKSFFSSSEADEEPISRDNPVSCSKKYNIEVSLTRHRDPKPLFFLCVSKKIADVRARTYVYVCVSVWVSVC